MNRTPVASLHKILPIATLTVLLFCAPLLAAPEKEPRSTHQVSTIEWITGLWGDLTGWLVGELVPTPPRQPSEIRGDNGCAIDPNGGCGG
jgi:hypothetical protein